MHNCVGNDNIYSLMSGARLARQRLRVDLADFEGNVRYAEYDNFIVYPTQAEFTLVSLGAYNGNAGQYDWNTSYEA